MATYNLTLSAADKYFENDNHPMSEAWKACTEPKRRGAFVAQAVRDYCAFTGVDVTQMEARTGMVPPRMDYAVFERALYLMLHSGAVSDGNVSGPKFFGVPVDASTAASPVNPAAVRERSEAEQRWWPIHVSVTFEGL